MTAKEHNKLVGIFLMAHGGLQGIVMILMCLIYGGVGIAMLVAGDQKDQKIAGIMVVGVIVFIAIFACLFIIPQILAGFKLFKERANARTWGIVGSILCCLSFPLGTAAGAYGLWFLFGDQGKQFYMGGGNQPMFQNPQPPAPNSWQ